MSNFEYIDLRSAANVSRWLDKINPDIILHLGARTDLEGLNLENYSANTIGVQNICNWLKANPSCHTALFASSRLVCRIGYQPTDEFDTCPSTVYGISKVEGEKIIRNCNLSQNWLIFRPTSIWGPYMGAPYNLFFQLVSSGLYLHPSGYKIKKSFGYIKNLLFQLSHLIHNFPVTL